MAKTYAPSPWVADASLAVGYRIGAGGGSTTAWEVLDFEYEELENEHTKEDVADFLKIPRRSSWAKVLEEFRKRYGDSQGIWITEKLEDAIYYYAHPGEQEEMYRVDYDPKLTVIDLGDEGKFVLDPKKTEYIGLSPKKHATAYR